MYPMPKRAEPGKILYTQAYDYILDRIRRGDWKAHDKLPSVRALAGELQLHRLTVFRAYRLLKEHGIVYVKEKSGYYVSEGTPYEEPAGAGGYASAAAPRHEAGRLQNALSEIHRIPADYSFSQALIDPNLLPNLFLSDHVKQVFDRYPKLLGTYSSVQGDEELRELLSADLQRKNKLQVSPDELLITTGGQQAIDLLAGVYLRPMDYVLVERPTYSSALDCFRQRGAVMEQALASGTGWQWFRPQGGLNLWVHLPDGLNANRLLTESIRHGLTFVPGTICDPMGEMNDQIRLSYSFMNEARIQEGVHLLVRLAEELVQSE